MKYCIFTIGLLIASLLANGQSDPVFSQNMFNLMAVNPAYAGNSDKLCLTLTDRKELFGFGDFTPNILSANVNTPFKLFSRTHGVGLSILNDRGFAFSNILMANLSYAFIADLGPGKISIGLNGGVYNNSLKNVNWEATDGVD